MQSDYTLSNFPSIFSLIDKKEHLKRWSEKYCAEKLRKQGFVDYNQDALCWYKVLNGEVLQAVFIFNNTPFVPLNPTYCCVMHPLFVDVPIPYKVSIRGTISEDDGFPVYLDTPQIEESEDCRVMATDSPGGGSERLDQVIFPTFSKASTLEEVYAYFKTNWWNYDWCFSAKDGGEEHKLNYRFSLTRPMIAMAIYLDDQEMYPHCVKRLEECKRAGRFCRDMDWVVSALAAIQEGNREEFLQGLEKTKKKMCKKLEKKLGIRI